jgi:hypothetical protein
MSTFVFICFVTNLAIFYFNAYTSQEYNYSLPILLIWYSIYTLWAYSECQVFASVNAAYYVTTYYFTLRFNQISQQLKRIQKKNFMRLLELISAHNILSIYTEKCNILFSLVICVMYLIGTVVINLMIYLSIYGNLHIILRLTVINVSIFALIFLFSLTYNSAVLTTEAHKAYDTANSIFVRYKFPLIIKLKVFTIIEVFKRNFFFH